MRCIRKSIFLGYKIRQIKPASTLRLTSMVSVSESSGLSSKSTRIEPPRHPEIGWSLA